MIYAVRVTSDHVVDNWLNFEDTAALQSANAISAPFVWIGQPNWTANQNPLIGYIWDAVYPASFTAPPNTGTAPATQAQAFRAIADAQAALASAISDAAAFVTA